MSSAGKFCCFSCPRSDFSIKPIEDLCPECGRPYNYELLNPPKNVGDFRILKSLGRGFYGATFIAEKTGPIPRKYVLKIVPKKLYEHFGKNFNEECTNHATTAEGADYIVDIADAFDSIATFGEKTIEVHVAVLEYLNGKPLQKYLNGSENLQPSLVAQISCDLIKVVHELRARGQNHNDFHAGNILIEELTKERSRDGAIETSIRAVAIDLGSTSGDRRSGGGYKSDLHWVAEHIEILSRNLVGSSKQPSDLDARVSLALQDVAASISAPVEAQRTPYAEDLIRAIEDAYYRSAEPWRPWRKQLAFRKFDESYNAQTLAPWHVPQLLVDPEGEWQKRTSSKGPLIVTGMRGCGKTMLLRSLQFHARARQGTGETDQTVLKRLEEDGFVGFFVSAQILVDSVSGASVANEQLFARLTVAYALEAARALAHLKDIDEAQVAPRSPAILSEVLEQLLTNFKIEAQTTSIERFEHTLIRKLLEVSRADSPCRLEIHPSKAFPVLAKAIVDCSKLWEASRILFLLDDVSTRYLEPNKIEEILSAIIFQTTDQTVDCSFKLTSETQTIFLSLKSLGGIEQAAHWRDFETFDLGAEVYKRLKGRGGKDFIGKILAQRSDYFPGHPEEQPASILGDKTLKSIAETICKTSPTSASRKSVYSGISALKAVCVGDIGSVISIYESILQRGETKYPVSARAQSEVFQDHCSQHLYVLDRRGSELKSAAKSFASASNRALRDSYKKGESRGLRQYTSIYVRVSAEDERAQSDHLRELVDAGVFVFHGGTPRSKTHDSDPVQQFQLVFRKIYGLADFLPLADRDRFELSGHALSEWLTKPEDGADLLCRNLGEAVDEDVEEDEEDGDVDETDGKPELADQISFEFLAPQRSKVKAAPEKGLNVPSIRELYQNDMSLIPNVSYLAGLGFEECCKISVQRSLEILNPHQIRFVKYELSGRSEQILELVGGRAASVFFHEETENKFFQDSEACENTVIDISGLSKSLIFKTISETLRTRRKVIVCYTEPQETGPSEQSLRGVLKAQEMLEQVSVVEELRKIVGSEFPPYSNHSIENIESDATRARSLLAFSSPAHERLVHLVTDRSYNHVDVLTSSGADAGSKVAAMVAQVAVREAETHEIIERNMSDLPLIIETIEESYRKKYYQGGMNFEIGLTGGKLSTLASAAFCSMYHVNNVWYVRPNGFDTDKFSTGAKETRFFEISI